MSTLGLKQTCACQPGISLLILRRHSVADNRYLLQNAIMRRLDSFHAWGWVVALFAVAVPALAIEQQGPENRGTATNMITQSKIVNDAKIFDIFMSKE